MHQIAFTQWTHDIRNALSTIALYVETLDTPENPQSKKTVANTQALIARAAAMCSGAAKQVREGAAIVRARFDVAQTIKQVRELVASTLPPSASLQLEVDGPVFVVADAQDVFRILFNLLHNAATIARRTGALRTIRVTVERSETTAAIVVSDDGPGLPEAVRTQLFRGARSQTGGSGHGLAIARELAERNGGTLRTADVPRGATFIVEVPLDASPSDRVATLYQTRKQRAANGDAELRGAA